MKLKPYFLTLLGLSFTGALFNAPQGITAPVNTSPSIVAQAVTELSEEQIREVMIKIEEAEAASDGDALLSHFAPFASSEITMDFGNTTVTSHLTGKQDHVEAVEGIYGNITSREILDSDIEVEITADGQLGVVTRNVTKRIVTKDGSQLLTSSTDVIHFALIDEKPMIVSVDSNGWVAAETEE